MNKEIKSPFVEFDYNKLRNEITVPAVIEIFRILADNASLLVNGTDTTQETIQENKEIVCDKIKEVLVIRKIPNCDMQFLLNSFNCVPDMFEAILKQKNDVEKALLTIAIGAKNPGTGDPSLEYATLGDLFEAIVKIKK